MEVNLTTRLVTSPIPREVMSILQIGSTPVFTFDLKDQIYTFDDISQMYFLFKQGKDDVVPYKLVEYDSAGGWTLDDHFHYDSLLNQIVFKMESEETLDFKPSERCNPDSWLQFEIVVKVLYQGAEKEMVLEYKRNNILVVDSLYKHIIEI